MRSSNHWRHLLCWWSTKKRRGTLWELERWTLAQDGFLPQNNHTIGHDLGQGRLIAHLIQSIGIPWDIWRWVDWCGSQCKSSHLGLTWTKDLEVIPAKEEFINVSGTFFVTTGERYQWYSDTVIQWYRSNPRPRQEMWVILHRPCMGTLLGPTCDPNVN